ncbi:MAG: 5-(carboxyamino)imidazole ribonucleotide synthase [Thiotrichales bacterium]|nr:5-(carboxyamino)imidazole ribonucleotide synthase [Thiotrichales bacterium]
MNSNSPSILAATESFSDHQRPRLGIIGGGQLAKMTAAAAQQLGCEIAIIEKFPDCPAAPVARHTLTGDWNTPEALLQLAGQVDVVTLENEFVDAGSLARIEEQGHTLLPSAETIALVQDKLIQKQTLSQAGLPMPPFRGIETRADIETAAVDFGWPLVLKARRNGYDGKGNATLESASDIDAAWNKLDGDDRALYVEQFCPFRMELAVMATRAMDGTTVTYPVVESIQKDHICHIVRAPANIPDELHTAATEFAVRAVEAIDGIGSIGVEMFLTEDRQVLLNEMAPRVHNSGHYTIEACDCSQFENHVRAVLGWPLGSTAMKTHAAVMVNLLGQGTGSGLAAGMEQALALPGVHVHVYGKTESRPGRKMGHLTVTGEDAGTVEQLAVKAAGLIQFGA